MAKIILPISSVQTGGNLKNWFQDRVDVNTELTVNRSNGSVIINDINASTEQKIVLTQQELLDILAESGEVEEYLAGIRMPKSFGTTDVPSGLPFRLNVIDVVRKFKDWFLDGAEVWFENSGDELIFYTNPAGGLASISEYLKASEMEIIRQLDTINITILTISEVQSTVATGWTKKTW